MKYDLAFVFLIVVLAAVVFGGCAPRVIRTEHVEHTVEVYDNTSALAHALDATVTIEFAHSCGSGALVAPTQVITAWHVVHHEGDFTLAFHDGKVFAGHVAKHDEDHDLALVLFDGHANVAPLFLSARAPRVMESVWNFGAAACMPGHASRALWSWQAGSARMLVGGMMVPGMSGGPVVNEEGALVGINDAAWRDEDTKVIEGAMAQAVDYFDVKEFLR